MQKIPGKEAFKSLLIISVYFMFTLISSAQTLTSVTGDTVTLDMGSRDGVKVGMTAYILKNEEVSGQQIAMRIAKIRITSVKGESSTGSILEQSPGFRVSRGMSVQFTEKLAKPKPKPKPKPRSRAVFRDRTAGMTLVQKIRYADRELASGNYREAVRVYGILEKEAPDTSLFADNYEKAKEGLARAEEAARRRRAEREELANIRKNLDYYRLVVEKSRDSDLAKAIRFQRDICRVDNSRKERELLKDLAYEQAVKDAALPANFEFDAIADIVSQFPERSKTLREQAETHRKARLARETTERQNAEQKINSLIQSGHKYEARIILRKLIANYPQNREYQEKLQAIRPNPGESITIPLPGHIPLELVWIPAGSFNMGSPSSENGRDDDEGPVHRVTLTKGYWMGKYEVTQAQWQAIMGHNPSLFKGDNRPVEQVSWSDVQEFIETLNRKTGRRFRLPTEAEWEYACRAGTDTAYSFGDNKFRLSDYAWKIHGLYGKTHPVGQKKPNPWGLYDMHGNVYEWCSDWYGRNYYKNSPVTDPTGPASGDDRVNRGGSWSSLARYCRSANRNRFNPSFRINYLGFRLVLAEE